MLKVLLFICTLSPVACQEWKTYLYGAVLPAGLQLADNSYLFGFLDLLVHTAYRDLLVDGHVVPDAVPEHVGNNPILQQRCCARLVLPPEWTPHHSKYFLIAPMFMEDRASALEVGKIVVDFMPSESASKLVDDPCQGPWVCSQMGLSKNR